MTDISTISFIIVLFIALCATLYLQINRKKGFVAGESIRYGSPLFLGVDGKVYTAARCNMPLGFCIEDSPTTQGNEWDSGENVFEYIKAAIDMLNDPNDFSQ